MADDEGNKSEAPTEKRLQEAWSEGRFAKTPDLMIVAVLCAAMMTISSKGHDIAMEIASLSVGIFGHLGRFTITAEAIPDWAGLCARTMIGLLMPVCGACLAATVIAGGLQTRFRLSPKVLELKFDRLDPAQGFARIFSKQGLVKLAFELAKLVIIGWVVWSTVKTIVDDPIFYAPVSPDRLITFFEGTVSKIFGRCLMALGAIAGASYLYQFKKTESDLKMTKQEIKEENKQSEGDPKVKGMLRAMARRLLKRQMLSAVPTADVVVTNPTHFAVALKYERGKDKAPVILAKGENAFARRIKALAAEHEVPMVENKPVARMLFKYGKVGKPIPSELYQVVADILAFVYKTHRYYFHRLRERRMQEVKP